MEFQESSNLIGQVKVGYDWPKPIDSDWMRKRLGNISKSNFSEYIWGGFAIRKQKLQELSFKTIHNTLKWENFSKKTQQVVIFKPFSTGMGLDFHIFLATAKSKNKCKIYILDEAVGSQPER